MQRSADVVIESWMASSVAAGLRCMYRCVVDRSAWPAKSWMARAGAPFIARCEQNVCRRM